MIRRMIALALFVPGLALPVAGCGQVATKAAGDPTSKTVQVARAPDPNYAFPALTGRVVDAANILPPASERGMTARLAALERETRHQVVVVTLPSLGGHDIADFADRLGNFWKVGRAGYSDGIVMLIAPKERSARISVGDGLTKTLTNDRAKAIIDRDMIPAFRRGDYAGGLRAGVDAIANDLTPPRGTTI